MATKTTTPDTFIASAAIDNPYRFVEVTGNNTVATCNAAGEKAIGIAQAKAASGAAVPVDLLGSGKSKIELGASLSANAYVTTSNVGKAVAATEGHTILGILTEGGADGDVVGFVPMLGYLVPGA